MGAPKIYYTGALHRIPRGEDKENDLKNRKIMLKTENTSKTFYLQIQI
jgi:hypothetical protein